MSGLLSLANVASIGEYIQVIRSVTYDNTASNPTTTPRIIDIQCTDSSSGASNVAHSTIRIIPVNDPPVVDLNGPILGDSYQTIFTEGGGAVNIMDSTSALISDVDSTTLLYCQVEITMH